MDGPYRRLGIRIEFSYLERAFKAKEKIGV